MSDSKPTAPPARSDADMLARFQNSKKRPPCSDTLGMRLTEVEQAAKRIRMDFDVPQMFANPTGAVQGGFIAAMMDEAMSTCCIIASNVTMTAPTLEMKTSYLRRLMPGKAHVEARILKWGRSAAFMEAECFDHEGKLVAKATATALPMPFKRLS
ncbi:MAG: PaaI family thioesterase, partial [Alphaproteobacteria bacterium]|nr:PaaI family thioesterase [Alphaproteobacteria bacterium]